MLLLIIIVVCVLQNQMPVQMFVEVSPQHQSFVTGDKKNNILMAKKKLRWQKK